MPTILPIPIEFRLPEGWRAAPPDQVGAPNVAFVALRPKPAADFTANITIDGEYRPDSAPLAELADESLQRMRQVAESVTVINRRELGSAEASSLTQELSFSALVGNARHNLLQSQVYLSMLDIEDSRKRAIIRLALTATTAQHHAVLGDFTDFVRTVRPDTRGTV